MRVKEFIGDFEPGFFVFLEEDKSGMILARAGEDKEWEIVATDEVYKVHVDYWENFKVTEIGIR